MTSIGPGHRQFPVDLYRFPWAEVFPGLSDVPFISIFVDHNWLANSSGIEFYLSDCAGYGRPSLRCNVLQDDVVYPGLRIVIETQATIVNPAEVAVGVKGCEQLPEFFPIFLRAKHIELICQRPPDVAK